MQPHGSKVVAKPLISIVGPTACGKTAVAVEVADAIHGAILSADSRQLYRGMDIGTGKDLTEYARPVGESIPYYLIDVAAAGEKWSLYDYLKAFYAAHEAASAKGYWPILCGGTGLYAEAVLRNYNVPEVPENPALRESLAMFSTEELTEKLTALQPLHNTTDTSSRQRLIRAIEIAQGREENSAHFVCAPRIPIGLTFAIAPSRENRRARISARLDARLAEGLVEEVQDLVAHGVTHETLQYYGLEYRYASRYLLGELTLAQMRRGLETAIHQFAKRQMTYLRGMEKRGVPLQWIDGDAARGEIIGAIVGEIRRHYANLFEGEK